jgi:cyclase
VKARLFLALALVSKYSAHASLKQTANRAVRFLQLPCIVLICFCCETSAQGVAEPLFTLKQVGPNVWAAISNRAANTGFVIGDDGVVVIDTTASVEADGDFSPEHGKQLLAAIRKMTNLPVKFVINTHYHFDHVAANTVFVDAGATVLAHRNVRDWIHSENLRLFGNDIEPQHKRFIDALLPPAATYDQAVDLWLGSREIRIRSFPGHTGSDSVVLIPDAKVVFAGDLFWRNMLPNMIDASTKPWIASLETLATNAGYVFVPGHGDIGTAQDVAAFREYLVTLQKLVSEYRAQGKTGPSLTQVVVPALAGKYGQWEGFNLAEPSILQMETELSGRKRIPQAHP